MNYVVGILKNWFCVIVHELYALEVSIEHYDFYIIITDPVYMYSVMQSEGKYFCGDVVLDSFKKAYRDEDNILDKIYQNKYVRKIITRILILFNIKRECILTQQ